MPKDIWYDVPRKRCCNCNRLTHKWQRVNRGPYHCFDGCFSTTGWDYRATDGIPIWYNTKERKKALQARKTSSV
jgi:hypothetical protein